MPKRKPILKPIPEFRSEAEERKFWETHDTTHYVDWSRARLVKFPNLKPSTETISLRLPAPLLSDLKVLANKRDVPYQSLLKVFLADRVAAEWRAAAAGGALPHKLTPSAQTNRRHVEGRTRNGRSKAQRKRGGIAKP